MMLAKNGQVRSALAIAALVGSTGAVAAQQPATLSLDQAIQMARQSNPVYRMTVNNQGAADWAVRQAYADLLPGLDVSNSFSYRAGGTPIIGNLSASELGLSATPATYTSSYGIGVGMSLSGATFFNIAQQRANQSAVEARIDAAGYDLVTLVTAQYLGALRARDGVTIAKSALESTQEAYKLAETRLAVGAATRIDLTQAQVDRGRAEVAVLQAENLYDTERLRLMQTLGVEIDREIELTSTFPVFEPQWTLEELTQNALASHPQLVAARKDEAAASAVAKAAWSSYLPTLSFFGQWSGRVQRTGSDQFLIAQAKENANDARADCEFWNRISSGLSQPLPGRPQDCSAIVVDAADEARIINANNQFPFNYTGSPVSFGMSISLPIWDGFSRQTRLQTTKAAAEDAKYQRRAEELARRTAVATNLLNLRTAFRTVQIEESNVSAATELLTLARERYRLGAGCGTGAAPGLCTSFLELTQAQERKARADQAHLNAVYSFHETMATLEAAVGRSLR
jgi:outer membrane protein